MTIAPQGGPEPLLGSLVGGFVLMAVGIAALTAPRRDHGRIDTAHGTRRALLYALVYTLCSMCFMRVVGGALAGREHSPWLLALGDVLCVTLGLFAWVMVLAENHPLADFGLRGAPVSRFVLTLVMGLGAVAVYAFKPAQALAGGERVITSDGLVFAVLFASLGTAVPEEMLFRGYLQGSLAGRTRRWARLVVPALAFTAASALRGAPAANLTSVGWVLRLFGSVFPLGLWWGLMRDLSGGSIWPSLISHFLLDFIIALASVCPAA